MSSEPQVVFVVDPRGRGSGACVMARWVDTWRMMMRAGDGPKAIVLGGRDEREDAERAGMRVAECVPVHRSVLMLGARRVAEAIEQVEKSHEGNGLVVHALGWGSMAMSRCVSKTIGLVASAEQGPGTMHMARLAHKAGRGRRTVILAERENLNEESTAGGLSGLPIEVMRGWTVDEQRLATRASVREQWMARGLIDERTTVVGVLGDAENCDAWVAANMGLRCVLAGMDVRMVIHRDVKRIAHARGLAREFSFGELFILDDRIARPWEIVSGLDVAMTPPLVSTARKAQRSGGLPWIRSAGETHAEGVKGAIAWCHAAGTPVIVEEEAWLERWINQGLHATFVASGEWNRACGVLMNDFGTDSGREDRRNGLVSKHSLTDTGDSEVLRSAYSEAAGFVETGLQ